MEKKPSKEEKREFLLSCLRATSARIRAWLLEIDAIGIAVKSGRVTEDEGTEWARDVGLIDQHMSDALRNWEDVNGVAAVSARDYRKYPSVVALGREAPGGASGDGGGKNENSVVDRPNGAGKG